MKKHYGLHDLKELGRPAIAELKINRIIYISNFDNEFFSEKDVARIDNPDTLIRVLKLLQDDTFSEDSRWPVAVSENYELYKFEPQEIVKG